MKAVRIVHKESGKNPVIIEVNDSSKGAKGNKLINRARRYIKEINLPSRKVKIKKEK